MGLFDFLFGKSNLQVVDDRVWLNQAAKMRGVQRELNEWIGSDSAAILLVAHFDDVHEQLKSLAEASSGLKQVTALVAHDMPEMVSSGQFDASRSIDVIVAERHPLPTVDDALLWRAKELPCRCRLVHHVSLDDAIMQAFAGPWVKEMLQKLGMTEEEAIESAMVRRRIRAAQQRLQCLATGNQNARSAEDWMQLNLPQNR